MRKVTLISSLIMMIFVTVDLKAQSDYQYYDGSDGFFNANSSSVLEYRYEELVPGVNIPHLPKIGTDYNQKAPVGSGLLVLTGLGLGYLIKKKNKKQI